MPFRDAMLMDLHEAYARLVDAEAGLADPSGTEDAQERFMLTARRLAKQVPRLIAAYEAPDGAEGIEPGSALH